MGLLWERRQGKQPADIQHGNSDLKNILGHKMGGYLFISEDIPERQHSQREPSRNKGTGGFDFPTPPLSKSTELPTGGSAVTTLTT